MNLAHLSENSARFSVNTSRSSTFTDRNSLLTRQNSLKIGKLARTAAVLHEEAFLGVRLSPTEWVTSWISHPWDPWHDQTFHQWLILRSHRPRVRRILKTEERRIHQKRLKNVITTLAACENASPTRRPKSTLKRLEQWPALLRAVRAYFFVINYF